jgi:hypothetical protein
MWWAVGGLIAMAIAATAICAVDLRRARRQLALSHRWVRVTGTVTEATIREVSHSDMGIEYEPVVAYAYEAERARYQSERLTLAKQPIRYSLRRNAERQLARYAPGRTVLVYVDPANPAASVLERRDPTITLMWILLVFLWTVAIGGSATLLLLPGFVGPEPFIQL